MESRQTPGHSKIINSSPLFDKPDGWGPGFALATGHGPGVVVGPGPTNPNVIAQAFQVTPGEQLRIVARASSVDDTQTFAAIQVNWLRADSRFISVTLEKFKVTSAERTFIHVVTAPPGASQGMLYVAPGGPRKAVRYTEMALSRLDPWSDFMSYRFLGVSGESALTVGATAFFFAILYARFKKQLLRFAPGIFAFIAMLLCGTAFFFLETSYEHHIDSRWHQNHADTSMRWKDLSLDLGANPLYNFGIQLPMNPQLSPTYWLGRMVSSDHRLQAEGAFQAMVFFLLLLRLCVHAGVKVRDAAAISLVAVYYLCVPYLSGAAITSNAELGLPWQEVSIAALLTFSFFSRIGYANSTATIEFARIAGFAMTIAWAFIAYPALVTFFAVAATGLCTGALIGAQSKKELAYKTVAAGTLVLGLLAAGFHNYVLNLFLYNPQMYFLDQPSSASYSFYFLTATSLFFRHLSYFGFGGSAVYVFYVLAVIGGAILLRTGNAFSRRIVFAAIFLELVLHLLGVLNLLLRLALVNLFYAELTGLSILALLAGTAVWTSLRFAADKAVSVTSKVASRYLAPISLLRVQQPAVSWSLSVLALACLVGGILYRTSAGITHYSAQPPMTDSDPAQIQIKELAIGPGDQFKGRGAILVGMDAPGNADWTRFVDIVVNKYRRGLDNDLLIDAMALGIPIINEYGHWISPPMLALLAAGFYMPQDHIGRAAQAPRAFRANLARLMGVSLVISDRDLPEEEVELYRGSVEGHPLFIHRISGANLGQFSPTRVVVAHDGREILDHLHARDFDGKMLAIIEKPLNQKFIPAEYVSISLQKGPKIRVDAYSRETSLLVLPFDYSHCLEVEGEGVDQMIPVNLAQIGLVVQGKVSAAISYRYGVRKGASCRNRDLERIKALRLKEATTGRLFYDSRPANKRQRP